MKFIELRNGLSIAVDKIEAIEQSDLGSKVRTVSGIEYETVFPKNVLISFIETGEANNDEEILDELRLLNSNNQYFSG